MFIGHGGEFFKAGTAQPNINNAKGVATLNMLKKLADLSNPDYLTMIVRLLRLNGSLEMLQL